MRLTYFLACEGISVDQFTNNATLFNVFDTCSIGVLPRMIVVSMWRSEPGDDDRDFQASLRVTAGGEEIGKFDQNFKQSAPNHRVLHGLIGVPVQRGPEIVLEMLLNGDQKGTYHISVNENLPAPSQGAAAA